MAIPLKVLVIEDSDSDAALDVRALEKAGYKVTYEIVTTAKEMKAALHTQTFDLIIADHSLPQFDSLKALALVKKSGQDIPFILVSGTIGEENAMKAMKAGAHDYVMKGNLSRLAAAVERELQEVEVRRERKRTEEALVKSEALYHLLADNMRDSIWLMNMELMITYVSPSALRLRGFTQQEAQEMSLEQHLTPASLELAMQVFFEERVMSKNDPSHIGERVLELEFYRKDGSTFWAENTFSFIRDKSGNPISILCESRDITERKKAEEALRKSEEKYKTILDEMDDGYYEVDLAGNYTMINNTDGRRLGYTREELIGANYRLVIAKEDIEAVFKAFNQVYRTGQPFRNLPCTIVRKDGSRRLAELSAFPLKNEKGEIIGFRGVDRDITERKEAEEKLRESEAKLKSIFRTVPAGVVITVNRVFTEINNRLCDLTGYSRKELLNKSARILYTTEELFTSVGDELNKQMADKGVAALATKWQRKDGMLIDVLLNSAKLNPDDKNSATISAILDVTERKRAEDALRLSEEKYRTVARLSTDFSYSCVHTGDGGYKVDWITDAFFTLTGYSEAELDEQGCWLFISHPDDHEMATKPLRELKAGESDTREFRIVTRDGRVLYITNYLECKEDIGAPGGLRLFGAVQNTTEGKQAEKDLSQSYARLQKTLESAVEAIASIAEIRDPYTAGHQIRVTELACAIAAEIGLSAEIIADIRMGGILHDIGKMYVPAEILSKPGQLSEIEFMMIKNHPQIGYDIVKRIDFPCRVAQMVLQHHERLDGSGYPRGLKGDSTTIESKILAVADVVEAMSSHRPYRPALGIDKALEEISQNKGKLYDPDVVDACLKLFKEKGFKFE